MDYLNFTFDEDGINKLSEHSLSKDWPITYMLIKNSDLYVGETFRATSRFKTHLKEENKKYKGGTLKIITDQDFNVSAALLFENKLVEYLRADEKFNVTTKNSTNHNFHNKTNYERKFEFIWEKFLEEGLANNTLLQLKNLDIFKYSPYKSLTDEQEFIANEIVKKIQKSKHNERNIFLINGGPGTGKSVLASYLAKELTNNDIKKVGLVIAMKPLRTTFKKVFRKIKALKSSQVIGPNDVAKDIYDVLIVDEAHRLKKRFKLSSPGEYVAFDKTNLKLNLGSDATQLDWMSKQTNNLILFFDEFQSVRPSDISPKSIKIIATDSYELSSQMRIENSNEYVSFVHDVFFNTLRDAYSIGDYQLNLYEDFDEFVETHYKNEQEFGLSRMIAGYSWKWNSKRDESNYDILLGSHKLRWNSPSSKNWVYSDNAANEVGCIHTVQGYDLNFTNLIIGNDITYNFSSETVEINKENYEDPNGKTKDLTELKRYIINIYKTLMTRGIKGTNIFIVDDNFRNYFNNSLNLIVSQESINHIQKR